MRKRNATKTSTDDQHAGDEEHAVSGAPQSSVGVARGLSPAVCGEQAAGGCSRKNVVIQLEARDAEECQDDDRPQPQQPLTVVERLVPAQPAGGIETSPWPVNEKPGTRLPSASSTPARAPRS